MPRERVPDHCRPDRYNPESRCTFEGAHHIHALILGQDVTGIGVLS